MKKQRIWELDALRGWAFILMVFDHLTYDLGRVFLYIWFDGETDHWLYRICKFCFDYRNLDIALFLRVLLVSGVFLFVSGVSANLSKSNFRRGGKLLLVSLGLTAVTSLLEIALGFDGLTVYFGILHCLAIAMLLTPLLLKLNRFVLLGLGIFITAFGTLMELDLITFSSAFIDNLNRYYLLVPFNIYGNNFSSGDYYPLIPYMGIYIIGIVVGGWLYKKPRSLFKKDYNLKPLNYLGRNALWLYFAHQIVLFGILYAIGWIFL
ncbi:MAG: heparan-alpha-glucosaminide N-acetyltransferase domain-containing protein [Bacilli bacterium]